jgi:hypothetical protein
MNPTQKLISSLHVNQFLYLLFQQLQITEKRRQIICRFILGLLHGCCTGSIASIEEQTLRKLERDNFRYLVCRAKIPLDDYLLALETAVIRMMFSLAETMNTPTYLILDDTLAEKDRRSKKLAKGGKRKNKVGYSFVTAVLYVGGICIPLVPRLAFRKDEALSRKLKYVSKVEMARHLITQWAPGLPKNTVVIVDSWYASYEMIKTVRELGFGFIGAIRCNRRFKVSKSYSKNHPASSINDLRCGCHDYQALNIRTDKHLYQLHIKQGTLKRWHETGTLLLSKRTRLSDNRVTWRYIIAFGMGSNAESLLKTYLIRWNIETFHQVWKDRFHPSEWTVQGKERIERYCFFSILTSVFACKYFLKEKIPPTEILKDTLQHDLLSTGLGELRAQIHSHKIDIIDPL